MKTNLKDALKDVFQYILAGIIVIGWLFMFNKLFIMDIPLANEEYAGIMFGSLNSAVLMVLGYFFLSNKDSVRKTEMLYNSTPTKETPPITSTDKTTTTKETVIA